jgi:hypothetical protein
LTVLNAAQIAMLDHQHLAPLMADRLEHLEAELAARSLDDVPMTVVCVVRHGYAATKASIESLYRNTRARFIVFYLDVCSPPEVADYLRQQSRDRPDFHHLRIDRYVSRQTARLLVLDRVVTRFTVFLDNNMLLAPDCLDILLRAAADDRADVVSPFIVMHGGLVHFSGSVIVKNGDGTIRRSQNTKECPLATPLARAKPRKMEIDFAESHCCLVATDCFKGALEHVFPEDMHNSHTLGLGTYLMKTERGRRMIIEPQSMVSILPIGFGFDIPWLFESYMDLECFRKSYHLYGTRIGKGNSTTFDNLRWHRKHLLYLLLSMLEGNRLSRTALLEPDEVPERVAGYDTPLPDDALARVEAEIVPFVRKRHPGVLPRLMRWLHEVEEIISGLEHGGDERRSRRPADALRGSGV